MNKVFVTSCVFSLLLSDAVMRTTRGDVKHSALALPPLANSKPLAGGLLNPPVPQTVIHQLYDWGSGYTRTTVASVDGVVTEINSL